MKITIFGSCRQDSLYRYFDVTQIREALTYPHYSKEVVQAVRFCKGDLEIPKEATKHIFRTGILRGQPIDSKSFTTEYAATDLFVVEIASRKYYKYKEHYVHHILEEPHYRFPDISGIETGHLSDEEIEADLLELKRLFYPKPFFIVTHIYTRTTGSRYELVQLLKRLCAKHHIYLFEPVEHLKEYNPDVMYQKEDVISHYTDSGHTLIGHKYYDFIQSLLKDYRLNSWL
jgi:hypothetical protein